MDVLEQQKASRWRVFSSSSSSFLTRNRISICLSSSSCLCRLTTRQRRYSSYFHHASGRGRGFRFYLYCTVLYVCLKYKSSAVWRYCRQSLVCATIQSQTRSDPSMLKKENGLVECGSAGTSNRRGVCACATTSLLTCSQINQVIIKWIFLPFLFNGSQIIHTKNKFKNQYARFRHLSPC